VNKLFKATFYTNAMRGFAACLLAAVAFAQEEACASESCLAKQGGSDVDEESSSLAQLRARIKSHKQASVPCDQIDTTQDFCCWWPQPHTCDQCQQCTAGWGSCPGDDQPNQCQGSASPTPPPTPVPTTCDGPFSGKDNGGTNMNNGEQTASADECKANCEATQDCKGYTWKTDSSQCWLKSSVDAYVIDDLSASGDCHN
jgi:hypothetical protein